MNAADLVDAAPAGLDRGELVTVPSLPELAEWDAYDARRRNLRSKRSLAKPAARYQLA